MPTADARGRAPARPPPPALVEPQHPRPSSAPPAPPRPSASAACGNSPPQKTCVLCFSRRKADEWMIRSGRAGTARRCAAASSGWSRPASRQRRGADLVPSRALSRGARASFRLNLHPLTVKRIAPRHSAPRHRPRFARLAEIGATPRFRVAVEGGAACPASSTTSSSTTRPRRLRPRKGRRPRPFQAGLAALPRRRRDRLRRRAHRRPCGSTTPTPPPPAAAAPRSRSDRAARYTTPGRDPPPSPSRTRHPPARGSGGREAAAWGAVGRCPGSGPGRDGSTGALPSEGVVWSARTCALQPSY